MFVYVNLVLSWFDKKQYQQAIKNLNKLYQLDNYKSTDVAVRFRIAMAELIIRYELKDFDLLEYKINQVKKDFKIFLQQTENEREKEFIVILRTVINSPNYKKDNKLANRVKIFLQIKGDFHTDDTEMINYKRWLKEKFNNLNG